MRPLIKWLENRSPVQVSVLGVLAVAVVALAELHGPERLTYMSVFVLLTGTVAWFGGFTPALITAAAAAGYICKEEWETSQGQPFQWIAWVNVVLRLATCAGAGWFVASWRQVHAELEARVQQRTAELQQRVWMHERAEAELRQSKEQFAEMAESIQEVFWITDASKTSMLYISSGYERIWGRSRDSLYAAPRSWLEAIHPDDRERVSQLALTRQIAGDYDEEFRILRPDAAERWIRDRAYPVRDAQGQVVRLVGISEDITEKRLAEAALRRSEQRYRSLAEASPDAISVVTGDGRYEYANSVHARWVGRRSEDLEQRPLSDFWSEAVSRVLLDDLAQVCQSAAPRTFERPSLLYPDRWVEMRLVPLPGAAARPTAVLMIVRDITEQKQAEFEIRRHEARLRLALAAARMVTWEIDLATGRIDYSSNLNDFVGGDDIARYCSVESVMQQIHPAEREQVQAHLRQAIANLGNFDLEYRALMLDGEYRWVQGKGQVVVSATGEAVSLRGISLHITDRKLAEQRLAESLELNQKIVASSTVGISVMRASGECVLANESMAAMIGTNVAGVLASNFRELKSWRQSPMLSMAESVLASGEARTQEFHITTSYGRQPWFDCHMARFTSGGQPHLLIVALDITERKRAEHLLEMQWALAVTLSRTEELRAGLDSLLAVVTSLPGLDSGGVYLLNSQTAVLEPTVSHRLSAAFLHQVAPHAADFPPATDGNVSRLRYATLPDLPPVIATACAAEGLQAVATIPLHDQGQIIAVLLAASHASAKTPAPVRLALENIAAQASGAIARIRSEEARRQSEARLHTIINHAPIALFAMDRQGMITFSDGREMRALQRLAHHQTEPPLTGNSLTQRFPGLREQAERALAGEEFTSRINLDATNFEIAYSHYRDRGGDLAGVIGVATNVTERVRLERQLLTISEHEQARIGQDLHDGLCQELVGIGFAINSLEQSLAQASLPQAAQVHRIAEFVDAALTQSRQVARGLFPVKLEAEGLSAALQELAAGTEARHPKLRCSFEAAAPVLVSDNHLAIHLFRIAQEAVNNAVRHARARTIRIRLAQAAGQLHLTVCDDGSGVGGKKGPGSGMGRHIMAYRARTLNGTLQIGRGAQGGTEISCCVPFVPH